MCTPFRVSQPLFYITSQGMELESERLLFACAGLAVAESNSSVEMAAAALPPTALDPNFAQAFNLSSRATSTKKIWYAPLIALCA
jgi:hypothetical protein